MKTCLVTGATSGLGEEIVTQLAAQGADVLAVARNVERGTEAAARIRASVPQARIEMLHADLAVLSQVRRLADQVAARRDHLDLLVLNAAVARPRRELTPDGFEVDFATNHLSAFLLTSLLTDLLVRSAPSRVVAISSSGHRHVKRLDLDALPAGRDFHHLRTYSTTKLLNILFIIELSRRLADRGVTANAADPGFVRTALGRDAPATFGLFLKAVRPFQLTPRSAAATALHLATGPELDSVSGKYFGKCQPVTPSALAQDQDAAKRLWDLSETLTAQGAAR